MQDVACASARVAARDAQGSVRLTGHVPSDADRRRVLGRLGGMLGDRVDGRGLRVVPRPHCRILASLSATGLEPGPGRGAAERYTFSAGQNVRFTVGTPAFPAYVYVDYFDRAGSVLHIRPHNRALPRRRKPDSELTIGEGGPFNLRVGRPYGIDLALVVASSHRLFDAPRPRREPADAYLRDLRAALAHARKAPDWQGAYSYLVIETRPGPLGGATN